ncbi:MAG: leucyl aminopeptidase family protein, partial [Planctomycetota bacterium]|nr:leucyl aminopeptidase family protein [Planctomycetota bacterium]
MKFTFVAESKALRSADHLLVVAPATTFGPRSRALSSLKKLLDGPTADLVMQLGREATVGLLGGSATSLQGKQRVTVGVLPASVSRHASEARAESVRKLTAAAGLRRGKNAALLCLDDAAHELAACNAVGRALPDFTLKSGKQATATLAIACALPDGAFVKVSAKTKDVVQRAREAARFVDLPPTDLNPGAFAAAAKKLLRAVPGVKVTEVVGDALLKKKLGGIHAVGRTALSAPRMLVATANP